MPNDEVTAASNGVVAVIQADRDIAHEIMQIVRGYRVNLPHDRHWLIDMVARHRIAHSDPRPVAAREDTARLIDPEAFEPTDNFDLRHNRDMRRAEAFSAADRVLATHGPRPVAEGVTCVTKPLTDAERQAGIDQWATHSPAPMAGKGWEGPAYEYGVTWGPEDAHPDARAKKVLADTTKSAGALWVDIGGNEWVSVRDALAAMHQFATPPASDAAVPAGERTDADLLRLIAKDHERLAPNAYHSADTLRQIADRIAAAPKVASDTGAGLPRLTRAMMRAACKAHYGDDNIDGISLTVGGHDYNFAQGFARMWKGVRKALATPTDATDGATGGGEEWTFTPDDREKAAILSLCADQELSPTAVMRQALRLYQHDHCRRKDGETVTWSGDYQRARDFAGPLATTPGGDLLEQAVTHLVNVLAADGGPRGDAAFKAARDWWAAYDLGALKPAGDGGEA